MIADVGATGRSSLRMHHPGPTPLIRNEKDLKNIREYIRDNPIKWETDPENPSVSA